MAHLPYAPGNRVKITSPYGQRIDPITGAVNTWHGGIDIVGLDDKTLTSPVSGVVLVSQILLPRKTIIWLWLISMLRMNA